MTQVTLDYPFTFKGLKVESLTMRRPTVGDLIAVGKISEESEREIMLFTNLCQVEPDLIKSLDLKDYKKAQEAYSGFLS